MSKKKKHKKHCDCGKKDCPKCFQFGTYYIIGIDPDSMTKKLREMICHMNERGINVYHFASGKPGGCPITGCT